MTIKTTYFDRKPSKFNSGQLKCISIELFNSNLGLVEHRDPTFAVGGLAQMVERSLSMWEVPGSIPGFSSTFFVFFAETNSHSFNIHIKWTFHRLLSLAYTANKKKTIEPARIRTWNLLIRSQTRYPLRHRSRCKTTNPTLAIPYQHIPPKYNLKIALISLQSIWAWPLGWRWL